MPLFIKPEFESVFKSWYDQVSGCEKEKVAEVMQKAEESYFKQALNSALQPTAIEAIEQWLLQADEEGTFNKWSSS